eukprot:382402-Pyramimonas_sp.AAC.1
MVLPPWSLVPPPWSLLPGPSSLVPGTSTLRRTPTHTHNGHHTSGVAISAMSASSDHDPLLPSSVLPPSALATLLSSRRRAVCPPLTGAPLDGRGAAGLRALRVV